MGFAHVTVDDGKGKSLVQINVQSGFSDGVLNDLKAGGEVTTLDLYGR